MITDYFEHHSFDILRNANYPKERSVSVVSASSVFYFYIGICLEFGVCNLGFNLQLKKLLACSLKLAA
jgi:hypothetical protein